MKHQLKLATRQCCVTSWGFLYLVFRLLNLPPQHCKTLGTKHMNQQRDDVICPWRFLLRGGGKLVSMMDIYIHMSQIFINYRIRTAHCWTQLQFVLEKNDFLRLNAICLPHKNATALYLQPHNPDTKCIQKSKFLYYKSSSAFPWTICRMAKKGFGYVTRNINKTTWSNVISDILIRSQAPPSPR